MAPIWIEAIIEVIAVEEEVAWAKKSLNLPIIACANIPPNRF